MSTAVESKSFMRLAEMFLTRAHCSLHPTIWDGSLLGVEETEGLQSGDGPERRFLSYSPAVPNHCGWDMSLKIVNEVSHGFRCVSVENLGAQQRQLLFHKHPDIQARFDSIHAECCWTLRWSDLNNSGDMVHDAQYSFGWSGRFEYLGEVFFGNKHSLPRRISTATAKKNLKLVTDKWLPFACGLKVGLPTWWKIAMRVANGPRMVVLTDPVYCRRLLALRDIPDGKKRRDALLHWVCEHTRQGRNASASDCKAAAIDVRRHLRGQRAAACGEFQFEITESSATVFEVRRDIEAIGQGKFRR